MRSGTTKRLLPVLLVGPALGGLAAFASLALHETSAVAAGATTCGVTGTTANVTLDQTTAPFTSSLTQDGSGNLLVNGTACGNFGGGSALTAISLADASGATNQLVVLDQTGAGGIYPCSASIAGTLGSSDTIKVVGAAGENLAAGNSAPGVAGLDLNSCSSGQIGALTGVGHFRLAGGTGVLTLSAAGDAAIASPLGVPATLQPGSASSQILKGGAASDTIDFASVSTTVNPLIVNVSGSTVGGTLNDTATVGANTYDFTSGSASLTTFDGATSGNTTFYAGASADTFNGAGTGNTLSFADAPGSSLLVCVVHAASCSGANQAQLGATVDSFSGITTFVGLAGGNTDFVAGDQGGFSFTGNGTGNILDFSGAGHGVDADFHALTVSLFGGGSDAFSGISTAVGSSAGANTFVAGSGNETFSDAGATGGDTLDFTQVATSTPMPLSVNVSGGTVNTVANGTAAVGATTYSFTSAVSNFTTFIGASTGHTTFFAGPTGGRSFTGAGSGNTLDLSAMASGATVNLSGGTAGTVCVTPTCLSHDTISGLTTVAGSSAGGTTFVGGSSTYVFTGPGNANTFNVGSGSVTITDPGNGNVIDFSALSTPVTVNVSGVTVGPVATNTAATSSSTYTFSGVNETTFDGASSGSTTFFAGSSADTFNGAGPGNTLSFAHSPGSPLLFCLVHAASCSGANQAQLGATVDSFSGITTFVGLAGGNTDFVAGDAGGSVFTANGTGNTLDFSGAIHGVQVDFHTGTVSVFGGGTISFSGLSTVVGSNAPDVFVAGSGSETFIDAGSTGLNTLDLSNVPTSTLSPLTVNVSGGTVNAVANGTASVGSTTYTFDNAVSNFTSFIGASTGHTNFLVGPTGVRNLTGVGSGNILDLSALAAGATVDLSSGISGTVCATLTCASHDLITGLTTVTGSSAGGTTFVGGSATYSFTGPGNANTFKVGSGPETIVDIGSANTIDLSNLTVPATVNVSGVTVNGVATNTAATSSSTYTFSGANPTTFDGATSGNTAFLAGSSTNTFNAAGSGNTLSFANVSGSSLLVCVVHAPTCSGASQAQLGSTIEPFSGILTFVGLPGGNTTFYAGNGPDGFTGEGTGNTLSFASAPASSMLVCVVHAASCAGASQAQIGTTIEPFSGISTIDGLAGGNTTFVTGATGGFSFNAFALGNSLDLSASPPGTTVTITGPGAGTVTGLTSGGPDLFTGIQSVLGSVHIVSPVSALPTTVPATTAGDAYGVQLTGTGGTAPYSGFLVQNGSLPPGISLSGSGMLSGQATQAGTFSFVVSLLDANQVLGATSYTLTVNAPPLGYYNVASDGGIFNYGGAQFYGSMGGQHLNAPIVGMAETPFAKGYWEVGSDGGIFSFGNATFYGSTGSIVLNKPIVGMAATPSGRGYWLVASDGGIFTYGDAGFFGSAGSIPLNKPIVGMAATTSGRGYWLVASDGGIFTYGDAAFFGSAGSISLNKPIVGMAATPSGRGYWLVASDGGSFTYGDAGFFGSAGSISLNKPIVAMISAPSGRGYWLVASDGGIFNYGDAVFLGSTGGLQLNAPVVGGTTG